MLAGLATDGTRRCTVASMTKKPTSCAALREVVSVQDMLWWVQGCVTTSCVPSSCLMLMQMSARFSACCDHHHGLTCARYGW
jgi:hypothetical protein